MAFMSDSGVIIKHLMKLKTWYVQNVPYSLNCHNVSHVLI